MSGCSRARTSGTGRSALRTIWRICCCSRPRVSTATAGLQIVYITLGIYGWWIWLRQRNRSHRCAVSRTSARVWIASGADYDCWPSLALRWFLARFTDSTVPGWDGLTTALSLAATYGQCRKLLESWWIWILADSGLHSAVHLQRPVAYFSPLLCVPAAVHFRTSPVDARVDAEVK